MTAATAPPVIEVTMEEIEDLLRKASEGPLTAEERETIHALAVSYLAVLTEIENKKASIRTLRELVFGAKTEKKENVVGDGEKPPEGGTKDEPDAAPKEKAKPKGHGRTPAGEYTGATR